MFRLIGKLPIQKNVNVAKVPRPCLYKGFPVTSIDPVGNKRGSYRQGYVGLAGNRV